MSTDPHPIKVLNAAPSKTVRADEVATETAKTSVLTTVVYMMSIYCRKKCNLQSTNPDNKKPSCFKAESANDYEE
jgi:hypothetical protein